MQYNFVKPQEMDRDFLPLRIPTILPIPCRGCRWGPLIAPYNPTYLGKAIVGDSDLKKKKKKYYLIYCCTIIIQFKQRANKKQHDEYQILYIWTPWFTFVRPLALLFSDFLLVFVFYRSIREEWQNFMWKCLKIRKSWKVDRSKFCPKSIDQIKVDRSKFSRTYFCRSAPEHPIRSFSMTKNSSPSDFRSRTRWFCDFCCL